ncbi:MAG TPA: hypothetical protein HPP97_06860 [Desulfuromonadales bacterium]|nr:hypothetical protein [Desulfuromonadales bacterium]
MMSELRCRQKSIQQSYNAEQNKVKLYLRKCFLIVMLATIPACSYEQINRDNLRFKGAYRGLERYNIDTKDSLTSAIDRANTEISVYERHRKVINGTYSSSSNTKGIKAFSNLTSNNIKMGQKSLNPSVQFLPEDSKSERKPTGAQIINLYQSPPNLNPSFGNNSSVTNSRSELDRIWSKDILSAVIQKMPTSSTNVTKSLDQLISALSSTASIAQIRDLSTEPNFPSLLPKEREVILSCLPPPESAAFEAITKFNANFKQQDKLEAALTGDFKTAVVKLFEESERTVFLQYALFRLCEMSINAPSGFKNVFPVIVHDIVRRTAEMNHLATEAAENRRIEEEKTKQAAIVADHEKDKTYFMCIQDSMSKTPDEISVKMKICNQAIYMKGVSGDTPK